jgi:predicted RNA-binding Zn ribbon-like protein
MQTPPSPERPPHIRELPVVGGHLALDFANTIDDPLGDARFDHVATYPGLLHWSGRLGVLSEDQTAGLARAAATRPDAADAALDKAHRLREVIGALFTDIVRQARPPEEHWGQLQPYVVEATDRAQIAGTEQGYALSWPEADQLDAMLWPVAQAAVSLLTGPELHRVKLCGGCPWLFVDRSKNQSRRWCAMEDCGTHEKIRRYVTRRAARRSS